MTFRDDNGNELEFGGDFAMTKQAVSFFNFKINGDVSINFTVENNSVNRKVLNYYGPQMTSQVAFTKQPFNRIRNGNILDRGYIVIQDEDGNKLNCFYTSGNSNWLQLLNGLITELDYSGVKSTINYETKGDTVVSNKSRTSGIVFPLVDWLYNYQKGSDDRWELLVKDSKVDETTAMLLSNYYNEFYPCFYLKSLVNEISNQNGIKITGNITDDAIYNSIILPPSNGELKRPYDYGAKCVGSTFTLTGTGPNEPAISNQWLSKVDPFNSVDLTQGSVLFYTAPISCSTAYIRVKYTCSIGCNFTLTKISDGSTVNVSGIASGTFGFANFSMVKGDKYRLTVTSPTWTTNVSFKIENFDFIISESIKFTGSDYILPNYFLPEIQSVDIIKFLTSFFGCSCYYNEFSKSLSLNIIENIKTDSAYDWSEYYLSHRSEYTVTQAKNNYLKLKENNGDPSIKNYNKNNLIDYGEGNIQTSNNLKDSNELSTIPFTSSGFGKCPNNGFYIANVPLVTFTDNDVVAIVTSITNSGGLARLTGAAGTFTEFKTLEVVRVVIGNTDFGFFIVTSTSSTFIECRDLPFTINTTGRVYRQVGAYNKISPSILYNVPNRNISSISSISSITPSTGGATSTMPFAFYSKFSTGLDIDGLKVNLAYENPRLEGFTDPTIKQLYFNKISKFLQNPNIRCKMLLPESVYQSFVFDQFIYLRTENLTGYFFVDSIVNYVDGNTPVEVNLYML